MLTFIFLEDPTDSQIRQITQIYRQEGWWHLPIDDPDLVKGIVAGSHCFLLAFQEASVVGMGRAISDGVSDAYIQDVALLDSYKRQGIGSQIVAKLTERLLSDGLTWIGLIAERGGQGFYQHLGFEKMPNATPMLMLEKMKLTKLFPQDYPKYKAFFKSQRYELSVYSLASILAWRNQVYQPYGIVLDDTLVVGVNYTNPDKPHHLLLPISPHREYPPGELHGLARELGYDLFQFVPDDYIQRYDAQEIADLFDIRPQAEYDDYVYRAKDLAGLKGNKFSKKRNLIHQFKSEYVDPGQRAG